MEKKLHALLQIARAFQLKKIRWQVGGSCMLFLRGHVSTFRDIDIVVEEMDWNKANTALQCIAVEQPKSSQALFTTKHFATFLLQEVEVDLMAGFGILYQDKISDFPYEPSPSEDNLLFEDSFVPLASLRVWLDIYRLMERRERVALIEEVLSPSSAPRKEKKNKKLHPVTLVKPTVDYWQALQDYKQEMLLTTDVIHGGGSLEKYSTFEDWKKHLDSYANRHTIDRSSKYVEGSQWLLIEIKTQRILGMVNIRHYLNEHLLQEGGHIGYSIRPSERRKGYGSKQLELALQFLKQMGCSRALVTCDDKNMASMKTIEHQGGKLENKRLSLLDGRVTRRYWIDLTRKDER